MRYSGEQVVIVHLNIGNDPMTTAITALEDLRPVHVATIQMGGEPIEMDDPDSALLTGEYLQGVGQELAEKAQEIINRETESELN